MKFLKISVAILTFTTNVTMGQGISAEDLLKKSIAYHDPNGQWATFEGQLIVEMETPSRPLRHTELEISLPNNYFKSDVQQDGVTTTSVWDKGKCQHFFEGDSDISEDIAEKYRLNCERTNKMRNYYTYLYGLPMKLQDPGTRLYPIVEKKEFMDDTYYCLRVDYDEAVGTDRWYFYFDTATYQLRHYKFYHDETQNDGEYILLADEVVLNGMRLPKIRSWYTNADNTFLGTDTLVVE